jgi:hypothetical protein
MTPCDCLDGTSCGVRLQFIAALETQLVGTSGAHTAQHQIGAAGETRQLGKMPLVDMTRSAAAQLAKRSAQTVIVERCRHTRTHPR